MWPSLPRLHLRNLSRGVQLSYTLRMTWILSNLYPPCVNQVHFYAFDIISIPFPGTSQRVWTYHSILPSSLLGPLFSRGHCGRVLGQDIMHKVPNERYEYDLSTDTSKSNFGWVVQSQWLVKVGRFLAFFSKCLFSSSGKDSFLDNFFSNCSRLKT